MAEISGETISQMEVHAKDILEKIQDGQNIEYKNHIIRGDLDFNQIDLEKDESGKYIIYSNININKCTFENSINIEGSICKGFIKFEKVEFKGDANFSMVNFKADVKFNKVKFCWDSSFSGSQFLRDAEFREAQFCKDASFGKTTFWKKSNFDKARFDGKVHFDAAHFEKYAYFRYAQFGECVEFAETQFLGDVYFERAQFGRKTLFIGSLFQGDAHFSGAIFDGYSSLFDEKVQFEKRLIFDYSKIGYMEFQAKLGEPLQARISFKCSDINHLLISWDSIKDNLDYDGTAYQALVKNFNNLENFDDADKCYYQYRKERRETLTGSSLLLNDIILVTYGYGVRPLYPLLSSVFLILIFAAIYCGNPGSLPKDALILSMTIFATATQMDKLTGWYNILGIIECFLGWLLMACFLVSLAKKELR